MGNDNSSYAVSTQKLRYIESIQYNDMLLELSMVVNNSNVQAVVSNGKCAMCVLGHITQNGNTFHISSFNTTSDNKKQNCRGLGKALICWMLDKIEAKNVATVTLDVNGELNGQLLDNAEKKIAVMPDHAVETQLRQCLKESIKSKTKQQLKTILAKYLVAEKLAKHYERKYGFKRVDERDCLYISMKTTAADIRARCAINKKSNEITEIGNRSTALTLT
jgi:hypothetical protein